MSYTSARIRAGLVSPRTWITVDFVGPDDVTVQWRWSNEPMPDPAAYFGGYKEPRLLSVSPPTRGISDQTAQYEGYEVTFTVADTDRLIRTMLDHHQQKYLRGRAIATCYTVDDIDARASVAASVVWRVVLTKTPTLRAGFIAEFTGRDLLSQRFDAQSADLIPKRLLQLADVDGGTYDTYGLPELIGYGTLRGNLSNATSVIVGDEEVLVGGPQDGATWQQFIVDTPGCAGAIGHWYYTKDGVAQIDQGEGTDFLIPGQTNYAAQFGSSLCRTVDFESRSVIYGRGPKYDEVVAGTAFLTVDLSDAEDIGGAVVPLYAGRETFDSGPQAGTTWRRWEVMGHAVKDLEHWYVRNDGTETVLIDQGEGTDFLIPGRAGYIAQFGAETYRDLPGADGITRRGTFLYGRGAVADRILGGDFTETTYATAELGVITVTVDVPGSEGNAYSIVAKKSGDINHATTAVLDDTVIRVTLGTTGTLDADGETVRDPAKCLASMVAAEIDDLAGFTAVVKTDRNDADIEGGDEISFAGGDEVTTTLQPGMLSVDLLGIEDVGDGSGDLIENPVEITRHALQNWILGDYQTGAWLASPTWAPADAGTSQLDEDSFDDCATEATSRYPGSGLFGGVFGAGGERLRARDADARLMQSAGLDQFPTPHGSIAVAYAVDIDPAAVSALTLYDQDYDVLAASFVLDEIEMWNAVTYRYGRNYRDGTFPAGNAALVTDAVSVVGYGYTSTAPDLEFWFVRDGATADDLARRWLARSSDGRRMVQIPSHLGALAEPIGGTIRLRTDEGSGASGWDGDGRVMRVLRTTADPLTGVVLMECQDSQYLATDGFVLGDEDTLPDLWEDASSADRYYGYLADSTTGLFSDGAPGKELH